MKYLVPIDGSDNSKAAFYTAIMTMNKEKDELFLLMVIEDMSSYVYFGHGVPHSMYTEAQERSRKEATKTLHRFGHVLSSQKINYHLLLGVSNHIGEIICETIEKRGIDYLVIGRRGMSKVKRLFVGSTSKYCVEHAKCNVLVVKGDWGPAEQHDELKSVIQAEEEERKRRMEEVDKDMEANRHKLETLEVKY